MSHVDVKKNVVSLILIIFALHWQLNPTQVKSTCYAIDSTYVTLGFFNQNEEHVWFCIMNMQISFKKIISLFVK